MRLNILNVPIDNLSRSDTLTEIKKILGDYRQHLITTPNPEMLVESERDWFFKQVLKKADLSIADGYGLVLATKYLYKQKLNRWPGVELMEEICQKATELGKSIYLLGGEEGIAQKTGLALQKKYPKLKIVGAERGIELRIMNNESRTFNSRFSIIDSKYLTGVSFNKEKNQNLIQRIRTAAPDIIFVAFGHNKQEKWLAEFLPQLPSIKIGMGVGGAFDYLSGTIKRAHPILCQLGLEWLWRLIKNPLHRGQRIWRAVITFSWLVFCYKRQIHLPYRQAVIGFVINQEGKFFIAKRKPSKMDYYYFYMDHWQPPQGGIGKNDTPEQAVIREVKEETNMTTEIVYACQETYKYDWTIAFSRPGFHYRGQDKKIFLLKFTGLEKDIKLDNQELIAYQWVSLEELKKIIHLMRQPTLEILLKEYGKNLP